MFQVFFAELHNYNIIICWIFFSLTKGTFSGIAIRGCNPVATTAKNKKLFKIDEKGLPWKLIMGTDNLDAIQ